MQQILTAKLKLTTTPEQFAALRQTQLAYRDALNAVSQYAFSTRPARQAFTLENEHDIKPTSMHDCANACSKKALVARNVVYDASSNERDGSSSRPTTASRNRSSRSTHTH